MLSLNLYSFLHVYDFIAPSGIVENLIVSIESARSVTVYWLPPDVKFWNGVVTSYTVVYDNMGTLQGDTDEENSGLAPFMSQTISIPRPGQQLVNSLDPQLVSLPLRLESVLIEQLEEYHLYSFAIYQENAEGVSMLSEAVTQEMPEAGKHQHDRTRYIHLVFVHCHCSTFRESEKY